MAATNDGEGMRTENMDHDNGTNFWQGNDIIVTAINMLNNDSVDRQTAHEKCEILMKELEGDKSDEMMKKRKLRIVQGAGDAIITAMNNHITDENLQSYGYQVLKNLECKSQIFNPKNKSHAFEIIIKVMKIHKSNEDIQHYGCIVLSNLASFPDNKIILMEKKAHEVIVKAMNEHVDNGNIQSCGCKALKKLGYDTKSVENLLEKGAIDALLNAMVNHSLHVKIQENGCEGLIEFVNFFGNKETILMLKACDVVISAMKNLWTNERVLKLGSNILIKIIGEAIVIALNNHQTQNKELETQSQALLNLLSSNNCILLAITQGINYQVKELIQKLEPKKLGIEQYFTISHAKSPLSLINEIFERYESERDSDAFKAKSAYFQRYKGSLKNRDMFREGTLPIGHLMFDKSILPLEKIKLATELVVQRGFKMNDYLNFREMDCIHNEKRGGTTLIHQVLHVAADMYGTKSDILALTDFFFNGV